MQHKMASLLTLVVLLGTFLCSEGNPLSRIVGGKDYEIETVPWQASLRLQNSHRCGATFIRSKWLVTAAHCVDGLTAAGLAVGYGDSDLRYQSFADVYNFTVHPDYNDDINDGVPNDVAVIELTEPVQFDEKTNKIDLPGDSGALTNCVISGWGCTQGFCVDLPNYLQGIEIEVIQQEECKEMIGDMIQDVHVCVYEPPKSACSGDSGGPLSCEQDGRTVVAGATSWGAAICAGLPSVYTRISEFTDWIEGIIGDEL